MPSEDRTHPIILVSLTMPEDDQSSRSVSPQQGSTKELRGIKLFRAITRRLPRRSQNYEDDSTDSSSSEGHSDSGSGNNSPDCTKETSALRKVLNSLSISGERRSSGSSSRNKSSSSSTPKKILRQPVAYTYVRGLSGLPTIRVPRTAACCAQACRCHSKGCGR